MKQKKKNRSMVKVRTDSSSQVFELARSFYRLTIDYFIYSNLYIILHYHYYFFLFVFNSIDDH